MCYFAGRRLVMASLLLRRLKLGSAAVAAGCSCFFISPISSSCKLCCIFRSSNLNSNSNSNPCNCESKLGAVRMMGTMTSVVDESPSSSSSSSMPHLMLPPAFEGSQLVYKFYSVAERVVRSPDKKLQESEKLPLPLPDGININDIKFVGSSHGWLTLFNQRNYDVFLTDPLSGRYIKLPSIHTLPDHKFNLIDSHRNRIVSKVIISCSPDDDEEECRAMMSFGPANRLAFCCPGRCTEWTPIGDLFFNFELPHLRYARFYEDFVYCSRRKLFACITQLHIDLENWDVYSYCELENWDLRDPCSPRRSIDNYYPRLDPCLQLCNGKCSWLKENEKLLDSCSQIAYLVFAEQYDQLFLVLRFVMESVGIGPDGIFVDEDPHFDPVSGRCNDIYPYKTMGFSVLRVDDCANGAVRLRVVEGDSLDGLAMFIGDSHSFAISASKCNGLQPNSIYFTDSNKVLTEPDSFYGGHDIGIFNYENKTFSSCYYPCDYQNLKRIVPPPMWFIPSPN